MGTYFCETEDIIEAGLYSTDALEYDRAHDPAQACQLCGTPPAPRGYHEPDQIAGWLLAYGARVGNCEWFTHRAEDPSPRPSAILRTARGQDERCLCCASQLRRTVLLPTRVLDTLLAYATDAQRGYIADYLVVELCHACRNTERDLISAGEGLIRAYRHVHNDLTERDFNCRPECEAVRELALLLDRHCAPRAAS